MSEESTDLYIETIDLSAAPKPACDENNIPIVMSSSEQYLPYTCTTLYSLLKNGSTENFYDIFLINSGYSEHGIFLLEHTVKSWNNVSIRLVNSRLASGCFSEGHISADTYSRLLIPKFMQNYTDVIYLDSDTIVCTDIAKILDESSNAGAYMLSGVPDLDIIGQYCGADYSIRYYLKHKLGLCSPAGYLQAGVLVFHVPKILSVYTADCFLEYGKRSKLRFFDQDILNALCNGYTQQLDFRWNVVTDCDGFRVSRIIKKAPNGIYMRYLRSREQPWIIHYSGHQKPWNAGQGTDFDDLFWEMASDAKIIPYIQRENAEQNKKTMIRNAVEMILPKWTKRRMLFKTIYMAIKYKKIRPEEKL